MFECMLLAVGVIGLVALVFLCVAMDQRGRDARAVLDAEMRRQEGEKRAREACREQREQRVCEEEDERYGIPELIAWEESDYF
jgi:hypothetical protein